jgi:hypothetical protein
LLVSEREGNGGDNIVSTGWRKAGGRLALGALLAAAVASASSLPARAFNPQPEPPGRWGLFGIVADQTARVSVVNTSDDPHGYPPGPCRVALAFVDADGTVLKQARLTLRPGQATSLDYGFQPPPDPDRGDAVGAAADRGGRQDLRARIEIADLVDPGDRQPRLYPPGPCVPSVEVFETATGRTAVLVAEARMGAEPHLIPAPDGDSAPR